MMAPWKTCKELLAKEKNNSKTHFNNFVLGLPYIGSDIAVNRQVIVKNIIYTKNEAQNCALGVDNGIVKHYVLGNAQGIFKVGKTQDWDEIERLIKQYQPVVVIDALPYPKKPKELVKKYKHRVYMNFYKKDKDDLSVIRWGQKEQSGVVYADRTKIIDEVIEQFYSGKITFNIGESVLEQEDYIKHWESLYLAEVEDSMGIKRTSWESSDGNDHLAHATIYWYMAMQKLKQGVGEMIQPDMGQDLNRYSPVVKEDGTIDGITSELKFEKPKKEWNDF